MNSVLGHDFTLNTNPTAWRWPSAIADGRELVARARRHLTAVDRETVEPLVTVAWALAPLAVALVTLVTA